MWGDPAAETPYDLRFQLLRIPVRVHPMFWLMMALLGSFRSDLPSIAAWVACAFVSVLVHEFGHGLMARMFGFPASIVLYGMGGLCYSGGERQSPGQRLAVLFCGPGAGFLFAALLFAGYHGAGSPELSPLGNLVYDYLMIINISWSILNLFPIWPLDGGQITGVFLTLVNRRKGMNWTHVVSLVTAGVLAVVCMAWLRNLFMTLFFALFAFNNYQMLHAYHERAKYGLDDDDDWWRR